jgi:hypothetical protein
MKLFFFVLEEQSVQKPGVFEAVNYALNHGLLVGFPAIQKHVEVDKLQLNGLTLGQRNWYKRYNTGMKRPSLETPVTTASCATVILALGRDAVWKLECNESRN